MAEAQDIPARAAFRDAEGRITAAFVETIRAALGAGDEAELRRLAADLHEADLADLLTALAPEERPELVRRLGDQFDFAALTELDESVRRDIVEALPPKIVAEGLGELESDDAVYILEDLDQAEADAILAEMPAPERTAVQRSLDYPEESAGRLMQADFIAVPPFWTVGRTIDYLRDTATLPESFNAIFVVGPTYRLLGAVALDKLLRTRRPVKIADIMDETRHCVRATADREEAARLLKRYNLLSLPVVDEADRLAGVITVDDVVDVIEEEASEDLERLSGVYDAEISSPVWETTRRRFWWLLVNLGTAFLASSVIKIYEESIAKMVALSVLAPIVASQGGNAATQTMTVTVRALATQELGPFTVSRFVTREVVVSFLNGLGFALIVGLAAALWFQSWALGFVIGGAMVINLVAGGAAGVLIPLAVRRLGWDPAVVSGVFVTTVTDCVGFFAFLGLATWWFGLG